eukprot:4557363-Prymnesium_polylepis.2
MALLRWCVQNKNVPAKNVKFVWTTLDSIRKGHRSITHYDWLREEFEKNFELTEDVRSELLSSVEDGRAKSRANKRAPDEGSSTDAQTAPKRPRSDTSSPFDAKQHRPASSASHVEEELGLNEGVADYEESEGDVEEDIPGLDHLQQNTHAV